MKLSRLLTFAMKVHSFLVFFVFVSFLTAVFFFTVQTDHFWTRHPTFVHYSDLSNYWLGNYTKKASTPSFLGKQMIASEHELFDDWQDEALDWFEENFGFDEKNVQLDSSSFQLINQDHSVACLSYLSSTLTIYHQSGISADCELQQIRSLETDVSWLDHLAARKMFLQLFFATVRKPFLMVCQFRELPNVVPILSFERRTFVNAGMMNLKGDAEEEKAEPGFLSMQRRHERKGPLKSITHKVLVFANCLPLISDRNWISQVSSLFKVSFVGNQQTSFQEHRQFIHEQLSATLSSVDFRIESQNHSDDPWSSFLLVVRRGDFIVASMTVSKRTNDGGEQMTGMQITSLVFDESTRGLFLSPPLDDHTWNGLKSAMIVLMLQEMDKFSDPELQKFIHSCWIVDSYLDGLQFFQERAPFLLTLAFQTHAMTPYIQFTPGLQEKMAIYVNNLYVPLQKQYLYTTMIL